MILYFGNILSATGNNPSFIELLTPKLKELYPVKSASTRKNKIARLCDMIIVLVWNSRRARVILIDTYSYQGFYYAWIVALLCRFFSKPYIPIIRGGDFIKRLERSPKLVHYFLKNANQIISPSEYMKQALSEKNWRSVFIPNFIELNAYPFKKRELIRPRLMWVRSFHKIYNPLLALDILASLVRDFGDATLCMAGPDKDGSLEQCLKKAKSLDLNNKLIFPGKLNKEQIRNMAPEYDIFINTTTIDNHPVSVIEAMALGLLIISTEVGGIPHLIKHDQEGLLVPTNHQEPFVSSIQRLMKDPLLVKRLQTNAREKVNSYDWPVVKKLWIDILTPYLK